MMHDFHKNVSAIKINKEIKLRLLNKFPFDENDGKT